MSTTTDPTSTTTLQQQADEAQRLRQQIAALEQRTGRAPRAAAGGGLPPITQTTTASPADPGDRFHGDIEAATEQAKTEWRAGQCVPHRGKSFDAYVFNRSRELAGLMTFPERGASYRRSNAIGR